MAQLVYRVDTDDIVTFIFCGKDYVASDEKKGEQETLWNANVLYPVYALGDDTYAVTSYDGTYWNLTKEQYIELMESLEKDDDVLLVDPAEVANALTNSNDNTFSPLDEEREEDENEEQEDE